MTNEERKKLLDMGHSQHVTASSITLLVAKEVEEVLYGNEDKYKVAWSQFWNFILRHIIQLNSLEGFSDFVTHYDEELM